ncbi:hypothetical protein [Vogesella indigofera]|uniref:hypothetical protein n=1 Tax=Vogesella indigofera TaxID=45465 RepID=UPI0011C3800C|nr:hypothetical protein [Vogesella indigofera]
MNFKTWFAIAALSTFVTSAFAQADLIRSMQFAQYKGNRWPIELEFILLDVCLNGDETQMTEATYNKKRSTCACAVSKLEEKFSFADLIRSQPKDEQIFDAVFQAAMQGSCTKR